MNFRRFPLRTTMRILIFNPFDIYLVFCQLFVDYIISVFMFCRAGAAGSDGVSKVWSEIGRYSAECVWKELRHWLKSDGLRIVAALCCSQVPAYWLFSLLLCAIAECFARLSHCVGLCLSICLSHSWSVSKRCKLGSRNLHCRSLVYCDNISCHWVQGFPSNEGVKEGYPLKKDVILPLLARIMWKRLQIGTYVLLIITSTGDRLFGFINIDDLERPWTPQKEVFSEFLAIFVCSAHFNTELRQNGWRSTKTSCKQNF